MNLARLNHILIPTTRDERERWRQTRLVRLLRPVGKAYLSLSEEGRVLMVMSLFVGTAGLEVDRTLVYLLWALSTGLLLGALAVARWFTLSDVRLEVRAPARVALGKPLTLSVSLINRSSRPQHAIRIRGPFLPWDGRYLGELPRVATLEPHATRRVEVQARFIERGHHHLDPFRAVALAPPGLSVGPPIESESCRFVVVPPIAPIASLDLPLSRSSQHGGVPRAAAGGEALELLGVRPYRPGDAVRDLHPRTWARTGQPHVREYQEDSWTRVGVFLDTDSRFVSEAGLEAAVSLAAGLVARLGESPALLDVLVVDRDVHTLGLGRARAVLDPALDILACAKPSAPLEPEQLLGDLEPYLARLAAMVLVTQAADASRLELAAAFERRRAAPLLLRVHDDTRPALLRRRRPAPTPRRRWERVVLASSVGRAPLAL